MGLNFHWVWNRELAGCALPGLFRPMAEDLVDLRTRGIRSIVTLTELRLAADLEAFGLAELHFPIEDMGIPLLLRARETCRLIMGSIKAGRPVAVHCRAGLGRTGTMLGCCLVELGLDAENAIRRLRTISHGYIQTEVQEQFVRHYAETRAQGYVAPILPALRLRVPGSSN